MLAGAIRLRRRRCGGSWAARLGLVVLCALCVLVAGPLSHAQQDAAPAPVLLQPAFGPSRATTTVVAEHTLARPYDPVVVSALRLGSLLDSPVESLRMYACTQDRLVPIPFQIDRRDAKGRYLLPHGPDPDRFRPAFLPKGGNLFPFRRRVPGLTRYDELVFLARDAGHRVTSARWMEGATAGVELTVTDPLTREQAWVYLFRFDVPPKGSNRRDIAYTFLEDTDEVMARAYTVRYAPGPGALLIPGLDSPASELAVKFMTTFGLIANTRGATDIHAEVVAYRDGPVRVIRRVVAHADYFLWVNTPSMTLETQFYPDSIVAPYFLDRPLSHGAFIKDVGLTTASPSSPPSQSPSVVRIGETHFVVVRTDSARVLYALPTAATASVESGTFEPGTTARYAQWATHPLTVSSRLLGMPLRFPVRSVGGRTTRTP